MGILDRLMGKKKDRLKVPTPGADMSKGPITPAAVATRNVKVQMDLIMTQIDSLRMQYETINARLQNIERLVTEIRSFCR